MTFLSCQELFKFQKCKADQSTFYDTRGNQRFLSKRYFYLVQDVLNRKKAPGNISLNVIPSVLETNC